MQSRYARWLAVTINDDAGGAEPMFIGFGAAVMARLGLALSESVEASAITFQWLYLVLR